MVDDWHRILMITWMAYDCKISRQSPNYKHQLVRILYEENHHRDIKYYTKNPSILVWSYSFALKLRNIISEAAIQQAKPLISQTFVQRMR